MQDKVRGRDVAVTRQSPNLTTYTAWHPQIRPSGKESKGRGNQTTTTTSSTATGESKREKQPLPLTCSSTRTGLERQTGRSDHGDAVPTAAVALSPSSSSSSAPQMLLKSQAEPTFAPVAPVPPTPLLSSPLRDHARRSDETSKPAVRLCNDGHYNVTVAPPPPSRAMGDTKGVTYEEQAPHEDAEARKDALLRALPHPPPESPFQTTPQYDEIVGGTSDVKDGTPDLTRAVPWYNAILQTSDADADRSRSPFSAHGEPMRRLSADRAALLGDEIRNDLSEGEHERVVASDNPLSQRRGHLLRFRATRGGFRGSGSGFYGTGSSNSYRNGPGRLGSGSGSTAGVAAAATASDHSLTNLFVRNLPQAVDDEQLRRMFAQFGPIVSSAIMRNIHTGVSLGTAFVRYETHEQALAAFNYFGAGRRRSWDGLESELFAGTNGGDGASVGATKPIRGSAGWGGKQVTVQWAKKEHDRTPAGAARRRMRKLFVRNIPRQITQEVLEQLFGQFGPIKSVSLHRDTISRNNVAVPLSSSPSALGGHGHGKNGGGGYGSNASNLQEALLEERRIAFVTYAIEGVAEEAAEAVHNTTPFASCRGIPLMVKLAEDAPGRHPQSVMQQQQQLARQPMPHGGSVHNSLNNTLVSVTSEMVGGSGPLNSFSQLPCAGAGSPFANTITTNECHYDTMSRDWCSPLGASLRGMSSHDFASVSLNGTQSGTNAAVAMVKGCVSSGGNPGNTLGDATSGLGVGSNFYSLRDGGGEWAGQSAGSRVGLESGQANMQSSLGHTQSSVGPLRFDPACRTIPPPPPAPPLSTGWGVARGEGGGGDDGDHGKSTAGLAGADGPEGFYVRCPGSKDELATQTYPPPRGRSFTIASAGSVGETTVAVAGPVRRASTPQIMTTGGVLMSMASARPANGGNIVHSWHVLTSATTAARHGEGGNNTKNNNATGVMASVDASTAAGAQTNSSQQPGLPIADLFPPAFSAGSTAETPYFGNPASRGPAPSYSSTMANGTRNASLGAAVGAVQPVRLLGVARMGSTDGAATCPAQGRLCTSPHTAPAGAAPRRQTAMLPQPRSTLIAREQQKQQQQQQPTFAASGQQGGDGDANSSDRQLNALWLSSGGLTRFIQLSQDTAAGQGMMLGDTGALCGVAMPTQGDAGDAHPAEGAPMDSQYAYPRLFIVNDGRDTTAEPPQPRHNYVAEAPAPAGAKVRSSMAFGWQMPEDVVARPPVDAAAMTSSPPVQFNTLNGSLPEERECYATTAIPRTAAPGLGKNMAFKGDAGGATAPVAPMVTPTLWSNEATDSTYYDLTSSSFFMGGPSPYLNDDTLTLVHTLTYDNGGASKLSSTMPTTAACGGQAEPSQSQMSQTMQRMLHLTLDTEGPEAGKVASGELRQAVNDDDDEDVFLLLNEIERAATVEDNTSNYSHDE